MPTPHLGLLCGVIFGLVSVGIMLPMPFPDKRSALAAAFANRIAIGVCLGLIEPGRLGWGPGIAIAILISLPDAIITKAYIPILTVGAMGGAVIGWVLHAFGR